MSDKFEKIDEPVKIISKQHGQLTVNNLIKKYNNLVNDATERVSHAECARTSELYQHQEKERKLEITKSLMLEEIEVINKRYSQDINKSLSVIDKLTDKLGG